MHDVVVDVVHPGNGRDRRAGLFTGFDDLGFKLPAIAAAPCAGRIKIDRVHVSTYFYVDTIFLPGLLAINVYGPDAYEAPGAWQALITACLKDSVCVRRRRTGVLISIDSVHLQFKWTLSSSI